MRRSHWVWILGLCLAVFAFGCSGGGSSQTDGDVPDGDEDGDVPDGDEDGDVPDGDPPDGDCLCSGVTDCCDGCNPVNEGNDCDDGNACTLSAACAGGTCVAGEEVVCTALDQCHGVGTCNPETGQCSNPALEDGTLCDDGSGCTVGDACIDGVCRGLTLDCSAENECQFDGTCDGELASCVREFQPNGLPCEALEGVDGSGVCLRGECGGFGECDTRTYGQPAKFPCNTAAECASGLCMRLDAWYTYCSEPCGHDQPPCPGGMVCARQEGGGFACQIAGRSHTLPGHGRLDIYQACNTDNDCAGGLCLAFGTEKFCTTDCGAPGGGADRTICGDCGTCRNNGDELGFNFKYYCTPEGKQGTGDACGMGLDCKNRLCYNNYCTDQCVEVAGVDTCPDGFRCTANVAEDVLGRELERNVALCILETELNRGFAEDCQFNWQCGSGLCENVAGRRMCVQDCGAQACSEGVCTGIREVAIDTFLELWNADGASALATDDDGGSGALSKIQYAFTEAGNYFIKVRGYSSYVTGSYALVVTDGSGDPANATESEPNNSRDAAQTISYPVKVTGSITSSDEDWFKITIPANGTVNLTIETVPVWDMRCLPSDMLGNLGYGDECSTAFQCEEGLVCWSGFCTKQCAQESDCPDGLCLEYGSANWCIPDRVIGSTPDGEPCNSPIQCQGQCWPDAVLQQYVCSSPCAGDSDCLPDMGCFGGMCVRHRGGAIYPYGNCRLNYDCDSGLCTDGKCSATCTDAQDCEAGVAFDPDEYETCWPCTQGAGNGECNPEGASGPNLCVTANNAYFCGEDCTNDPSVCPFGTRCYEVGWFNSVCAPVTFSCDGGAYCSQQGSCKRPFLNIKDECSEAQECISGVCENGMCQAANGCTQDSDCGCDGFVCSSGFCALNPAAGTLETEPNNTRAQAMTLAASGTILASYKPVNGQPDVDIFKVSLSAGQALDVMTRPFCNNTTVDTYLRLLNASGQPIEGWENDDINPQGNYFSILMGYRAQTSQDVYIEVTQSPFVVGLQRGYYFLDVNVFTPAANDTCQTAQALGADADLIVPLHNGTNTVAVGGCVPYGAAGKDLFYSVTVPAGHLLTASVDSQADTVLLLLDGCAATPTCLVGSDVARGGGEESLVWLNNEGSPRNLILVVDSFLPSPAMPSHLVVSIAPVVAPDNDDIAGAIPITESGTVIGTLTGANDTYNPGIDGCTEAELPGPDVVYSFVLGEYGHDFISVQATSRYAPVRMYLLQGEVDPVCVAAGTNLLTFGWEPGRTPPPQSETYYLVVDTTQEDAYGPFTLTVILGDTATCSGLCDPAEYEGVCFEPNRESAMDLCICDSASHTLVAQDCTEVCEGYGGIGGTCRFFDLGADSASQCVCFYDCQNELDQCGQLLYTNCTCSESDPCQWQADDYCDAYCEHAYPSDHFDDSADCSE